MEWWVFIGAVGVTLIISKGEIFAGVRRYLVGFARWYNPLRWIGKAMRCSMCSGFWVGVVFSMVLGFPPLELFAMGGCVSLVSLVMGCAVTWFERATCADDGGDDVFDGAVPSSDDQMTVLDGIAQMRELLDRTRRRVEVEEEKEREKDERGEGQVRG
jgi:hypothetical protein